MEVAGKLRNAGRSCVAAGDAGGDAGRNRILYMRLISVVSILR